MAKQTKVRRISANESASRPVVMSESTPLASSTTGPGWAVWILSRFPGVRYHYQTWGHTKRIVIAVLLYLVALPIIPIILAAVWYAKDPEGFKKSPFMPVLMAIIAAWLGGFGWMANQTPITDGTPMASIGAKATADGESSAVNADPAATVSQTSKDKIANQTTSKPTNGVKFENCDAAASVGVFNILRSDSAYQRKLDRDNDGIACEK